MFSKSREDKSTLNRLPLDMKRTVGKYLDARSLHALWQTQNTPSRAELKDTIETATEAHLTHTLLRTAIDHCGLLYYRIHNDRNDVYAMNAVKTACAEWKNDSCNTETVSSTRTLFTQLHQAFFTNLDTISPETLRPVICKDSLNWKADLLNTMIQFRKFLLNIPEINRALYNVILKHSDLDYPEFAETPETRAKEIALFCENENMSFIINLIANFISRCVPSVLTMLSCLRDSDNYRIYLSAIFTSLIEKESRTALLPSYLPLYKNASPPSQLFVCIDLIGKRNKVFESLLNFADFNINDLHTYKIHYQRKEDPDNQLTLLLAAVQFNSLSALELILQKNPNPYIQGFVLGESVNALELAKIHNNDAIIVRLKQYENEFRLQNPFFAAQHATFWSESNTEKLTATKTDPAPASCCVIC